MNTEKVKYSDLKPGDQVFEQGLLLDVKVVRCYKHHENGDIVINYDAKMTISQNDPVMEKYRNTIYDSGYQSLASEYATIVLRR